MNIRRVLPMALAGSAFVSAAFAAPLQVENEHAGAAMVAGDQKDWTPRTASAVEMVKLKDAGLDPSVIKAYIQAARVPYKATAPDILYLHEHRIPDDLISEWIKKGSDLVVLAAQAPPPASSPDLVASNAQPPQAVAQPQVVYQAAPQPASPTVVYTSPSYVYSDYSYPYSYSYPWYSPISIGFSWGWGYPYYSHGHYYGGHYGHYNGGYSHGGWGGSAGHGGWAHGGSSGHYGGGGGGHTMSAGFHGGGGGHGGGHR
jgi:hypothetical protein